MGPGSMPEPQLETRIQVNQGCRTLEGHVVWRLAAQAGSNYQEVATEAIVSFVEEQTRLSIKNILLSTAFTEPSEAILSYAVRFARRYHFKNVFDRRGLSRSDLRDHQEMGNWRRESLSKSCM